MSIASFEELEWINPWEDRRPMTEDWVLVTVFKDGHKYVWSSKYEEDYGWLMDEDFEILGWMPQPEPMGGYMPYDVKAYVKEHYNAEEKEELPLEQA